MHVLLYLIYHVSNIKQSVVCTLNNGMVTWGQTLHNISLGRIATTLSCLQTTCAGSDTGNAIFCCICCIVVRKKLAILGGIPESRLCDILGYV